jgi:glycosyltransferase involved in cell wall biosynthesis
MHWTVAAPFFTQNKRDEALWLDDFVPAGQHRFTKIFRLNLQAEPSWHTRVSRNTSRLEWLNYWGQSGEAWKATEGGVITVFPQLASMVGLQKRLFRRKSPIVAYCFNLGNFYPGLKRLMAHLSLQEIDQFVVHSRRECETVSHWLKLPQSRFTFIPLQRSPIPVLASEEIDRPFILAMGSANRDYPTFLEAIEKLGLRTIIVTAQHAIQDLKIPAHVEVRSGLTAEECHRLAQQARINVIPLVDHETGAGQVTIVEAMRMSRPVIATRCVGSEDYIQQAKTGLLVQPYSVSDLVSTISQLWSDETFRNSLAKAAGEYAEEHFSDEVAGISLGKILDQF